jgi:hypothetical protein
VRLHQALPPLLAPLLAIAALVDGLAGCSGPAPAPAPTATATPTVTAPQPDRDRLAGLAAAAQGDAFVATYELSTPGRDERTVTVAIGTDDSWVVALPATALSGLADIAMYGAKGSQYQCLLGPAAGTVGIRPDLGPLNPGCVKLTTLTPATDPRVQHVFTDWLPALTDRATALSVARIANPSGVTGTCFSVESTSAALAPPVDPGMYCFDADGILSAASVGFGTLRLAAPVAAAPPSVAIPAPLANRAPVPMTAPAAPPPPPAPTSTTTPRT